MLWRALRWIQPPCLVGKRHAGGLLTINGWPLLLLWAVHLSAPGMSHTPAPTVNRRLHSVHLRAAIRCTRHPRRRATVGYIRVRGYFMRHRVASGHDRELP